MVINKQGETKVAQYGQWDGYPSGVGVGILKFLSDKELVEKFNNNLHKVRFIDDEGRDKEFIKSYNKNAPEWSHEPDNRTDEQKRWFKTYCTRDLAEEVLINIANSQDEEILLFNREDTGKGDGWVEFSYVINFKENTFSIYNKIDLPVIKVYNLDSLPSEDDFVKELEGNDEE